MSVANTTFEVPSPFATLRKIPERIHSTLTEDATERWTGFSFIVAVFLLSYIVSTVSSHSNKSSFPTFRSTTFFQPRYLGNWNFFRNAAAVINAGHARFPNQVWKFNRADTEMIMLPAKYVAELRQLPDAVASPTTAHSFNLCGKQTKMGIIMKNNLHFRTIQKKLTPNLHKLVGSIQEELDYALEHDIPECDDDWVPVRPYDLLLRIVSRMSARVFLGLPLCRSEEWLEISTQFTENTFITLVVLRLLPGFLQTPVAWLLPSAWRAKNYIRRAQRLLVPVIERKLVHNDRSGYNVLDWMMGLATPEEQKAEDLAHLEVVVSLASIHTSHMNAVHILYDIAESPAYIQMLRDEIEKVIIEDGPLNTWGKKSFYKLKMLDSFMRESQRLNPPTLLSFHRVMMEDYTLEDGTVLPQGSHIAMPVNAIQNDVTDNPDTFDPLRYYRLRQRENEEHLHQFATTEQTILNFGNGRFACPGRFFASLEVKTVLVRMLMEFEWKLPDNEKRPANMTAHEFIFPNKDGVLYMKRRAVS